MEDLRKDSTVLFLQSLEEPHRRDVIKKLIAVVSFFAPGALRRGEQPEKSVAQSVVWLEARPELN